MTTATVSPVLTKGDELTVDKVLAPFDVVLSSTSGRWNAIIVPLPGDSGEFPDLRAILRRSLTKSSGPGEEFVRQLRVGDVLTVNLMIDDTLGQLSGEGAKWVCVLSKANADIGASSSTFTEDSGGNGRGQAARVPTLPRPLRDFAVPGMPAPLIAPESQTDPLLGGSSVTTFPGHPWYQGTNATYDRARNVITASTETTDNNWFGGFRAMPIVLIADANGNTVGWGNPGTAYFVCGTAETWEGSTNHRIDGWWTAQQGPSAQTYGAQLQINHFMVPHDVNIDEVAQKVITILKDAAEVATGVGAVIAAVGALFG